MSTHFEKKSARTDEGIPMASLPDIIFMLLIFFMVSTVLRETDIKVRTRLPEAEAIQKIEQKRLISYIYIGPEKQGGGDVGDQTLIQIDDALIDEQNQIRTIMYSKLQEQPKLIVSLKVDQQSQMGVVTDVQQELREANTLRINYANNPETEAAARGM